MFKNKKGQTLLKWIFALLGFSLVIVAFLVIPNTADDVKGTAGFWNIHGYTIDSNNLSGLDQSTVAGQLIKDINCDITREDEVCGEERQNPVQLLSNFINVMVQGGFGALITIIKSIGHGENIIYEVGREIGVHPQILDLIVSALFITIIISILLLIFNRSDSG